MPIINEIEQNYSDEIDEIISKPPSWLLRWGLLILLGILLLLCSLSALIKYPDLINAKLIVSSANTPKPVISKISGRLVRLLVSENQFVESGQPLAYLESTGNHEQILSLLDKLKKKQIEFSSGRSSIELDANQASLYGELQHSYQALYESYLSYRSTVLDGFYLQKRQLLKENLDNILDERRELQSQKKLQEKDYALAREEYIMHKKLYNQKVEARMELQREEIKFNSRRYPLQQTELELLNNKKASLAVNQELIELNNLIEANKLKFLQTMNSFISETEDWKNRYVLTAPQSGRVAFSTILQNNQYINSDTEILYVNSGNTDFFGQVEIPQFNMGKIRVGQKVLIKLNSFPFEEYGILYGEVRSVATVPNKDSNFIAEVSITRNMNGLKQKVNLKSGMTAEAEIITTDATLLKRFIRSVFKND